MLQAVLESTPATMFLLNSTLAVGPALHAVRCATTANHRPPPLALQVWATSCFVTKALFLGSISVIEQAKLAERMLKFLLLKMVFLGTVVNPTMHDIGAWGLWFLAMAYLKSFVCLATDRCEALLSSPSATLMQHARCLTLLLGILGNTVHWMASYLAASQAASLSDGRLGVALLWMFDGVVIVTEASYALVKYAYHAAERWRVLRAEAAAEVSKGSNAGGGAIAALPAPAAAGPWAGRSDFPYLLDLAADLTLAGLTLAHYAHLWWLHGLRLSLADAVLALDVRHVAGAAWRRLRGHCEYAQLTRALQHAFPCAPPAALAEQATCAICFEALAPQSRSGAFSCPMCRADLRLAVPPQPAGEQALLESGPEDELFGGAEEAVGALTPPPSQHHVQPQPPTGPSTASVGCYDSDASGGAPAGSISRCRTASLSHVGCASVSRRVTRLQARLRAAAEQRQVAAGGGKQFEASGVEADAELQREPGLLPAGLLSMTGAQVAGALGAVAAGGGTEDDAVNPAAR
eukprot:scaffold20.g7644.t1